MKKSIGMVVAVVICATSAAYAAEKKQPEKTIGDVIVDIVTAPIKLVQDLMKK